MFGLIISDPHCDAARREMLSVLLDQLDLPLSAFTTKAAELFSPNMGQSDFLRTASAALLQPGQPLPMDEMLRYLSPVNPLPANVLRRYLFLQLSLLPYLRLGRKVVHHDGYFDLGSELLVAPVGADDIVDVHLPAGRWTELTGLCHEGQLCSMRGYNEMPVLARENALIPIGVNDRKTTHDDADRLTLHWYQPHQTACCILADGTRYDVYCAGEQIHVNTDTNKVFHLIVHRNGVETLIR